MRWDGNLRHRSVISTPPLFFRRENAKISNARSRDPCDSCLRHRSARVKYETLRV